MRCGPGSSTISPARISHRRLERGHLLRSLTPLYLARVASFVIETREMFAGEVENRIEALCLAFENAKPYLEQPLAAPRRGSGRRPGLRARRNSRQPETSGGYLMIHVLQQIFERTMARLSDHLLTYVPPLIVATVILLVAFLLAACCAGLILKLTKGRRARPVSQGERPDVGRWPVRAAARRRHCWRARPSGSRWASAFSRRSMFLTRPSPRASSRGPCSPSRSCSPPAPSCWQAGGSPDIWDAAPWCGQSMRAYRCAQIRGGQSEYFVVFVAVVAAAELLGFAERVFFASFVILSWDPLRSPPASPAACC